MSNQSIGSEQTAEWDFLHSAVGFKSLINKGYYNLRYKYDINTHFQLEIIKRSKTGRIKSQRNVLTSYSIFNRSDFQNFKVMER